eukprot:CAMPEP_0202791066 /NCGR_PEP_ID=MMETSP1388-20130828/80770_1 /ASSEMBLY_ACC=CAM_ASM_000864 /TAXON_ID=37098 /ORGANISM="Isochrysis sp, Strain CCMP1244" /LENGTH=41 /DNA_ID= /DNA_START= /DNA_END= /DNA_ORIENTATION=
MTTTSPPTPRLNSPQRAPGAASAYAWIIDSYTSPKYLPETG